MGGRRVGRGRGRRSGLRLSVEVAQKLGSASASAAEKGAASPPPAAQPQGRRGRLNPGGPVPVVVTQVNKKPLPIMIEAVGTVQAIASIQIKARIDSQIMKVNVEEGAWSRRATSCSSSMRTLKAQLGQIEAQIRKDQAQVVQAKRDLPATEELLAKNAGTVVNRDKAHTTVKAAEAQLEVDLAAKASVETQITYTEIRAPVSGRIGSISSKAGTVVRIGDNSAQRAGHDQPGRSDLRHLRGAAGLPAGDPRSHGQGRRQGQCLDRRERARSRARWRSSRTRSIPTPDGDRQGAHPQCQ